MCTIDLGKWEAAAASFTEKVDAAIQSGQLTDFEPSPWANRSWKPFLFEVESRKLAFAKAQIAGPATVRWVAKTSKGTPASEVEKLDKQIFQLLLAKSLAMVKGLRRAGTTPILYLDEPGLYALEAGNPRHLLMLQELKVLVLALQREGALVGLHCCSNTDWKSLLDLGLDLLSLDVRLSLDAVLDEKEAFMKFLAAGSVLSLGVVPTDLSSTFEVDELVESIEVSLRSTMPPALSFGAMIAQMPLTPACGLAMRSVRDAERIFEQVREAQRKLRRIATVEAGAAAS